MKNKVILSGLVMLILISITCLSTANYANVVKVKIGDKRTYSYKGNFPPKRIGFFWNDGSRGDITISNKTLFTATVCSLYPQTQLSIDGNTTICERQEAPLSVSHGGEYFVVAVTNDTKAYAQNFNYTLNGETVTLTGNNLTWSINNPLNNGTDVLSSSLDVSTGWLLKMAYTQIYNNGTKIVMEMIQLNATPISSPGFDAPSILSMFIISTCLMVYSRKKTHKL